MARGSKTPESKRETIKAIMALDSSKPSTEIAKAVEMNDRTVRKLMAEILTDKDFSEYTNQQKKIAREKGLSIVCDLLEKLGTNEIIAKMSTREALGAVKIIVEALSVIEGNTLNLGSGDIQGIEKTVSITLKKTETLTAKQITDDDSSVT